MNSMTRVAAYVVWRRSHDVASNYALTYARTRDFPRWENSKGQTIIPSLSPGNGDIIDLTGEGAVLLNLTRVGVSPSGKPIVASSKYGPGGRNVIILASPTQKGKRDFRCA
ncbi:BNR-4 repeat-containing protein [Agrobacterium pusense]|uniref:BNR-4 repeat-containing protein n=1 Tax=Agrobacterium pusense TaxID=648995 RepID=UPI003C799275